MVKRPGTEEPEPLAIHLPITRATVAEIATIAAVLTVLVVRMEVVGAVAAAASFLGGRSIGNLVLMPSFRQTDTKTLYAPLPD